MTSNIKVYFSIATLFLSSLILCSYNPDRVDEPTKDPGPNLPTVTGTLCGHDYVDLGLPSGLKWATFNVGASSTLEYGDYFAWGETRPKSSYTEEDCDTEGKDIKWLRKNGYVDKKGNLTLPYDAARQNWGATWRMPTKEEFQELRENTTEDWKWVNHVKVKVLTSKINGNTIYFPFPGYRKGTALELEEDRGYYWSSTPYEINGSAFLKVDSRFDRLGDYHRYFGFSVRPVSE